MDARRETRALRRRLQRRSQLARARTRAKDEVHGALIRRLVQKPKVSDLFGVSGRRWLAELELPAEGETVDGCLRQIDFLEQELEEVERVIANDALASAEIRAKRTRSPIGPLVQFPAPRHLPGVPLVTLSPSRQRMIDQERAEALGVVTVPRPVPASTHGDTRGDRCRRCGATGAAPVLPRVRRPATHRGRSTRLVSRAASCATWAASASAKITSRLRSIRLATRSCRARPRGLM